MRKLAIGLVLLLGASACMKRDESNSAVAPEAVGAGEGTTVATPMAAPDGNAAEAGATPCPIMRDFDWTAKIAGAGGARTLTVSGTIEVNRGGYVATLKPGKLDKSLPPIQHLTLTVTSPPPGDQVIQVISRLKVDVSLPAEPAYRAVVIDCDGSEIERIEKIDGG